jgi:hypothetical protein
MITQEMYRVFGDEVFGIFNGKVVLNRFRVEYEVPFINDSGEEDTKLVIMCFTSQEQSDEFTAGLDSQDIAYTITEIDQSANEWFNGLEFAGYSEAKEAFDLGQELFELKQNQLTENEHIMLAITSLYEMIGGLKK